jgi:hypothetical protein
LCHVFCSCAFSFADVLKLCIIPTYNFADVQMKQLLCYVFCSCTFTLSVVNCFHSCTIFSQQHGHGNFTEYCTGNAIVTLGKITGTVIGQVTIPVMLS